MSYQIYYNKQFVKVNDQFIPMTLDGSNNCYEIICGREVRERNWNCRDYYFSSIGKGELLAKKDIIINSVNQYIEKRVKNALESDYREQHETEEYIRNHYGYYSGESFGGRCASLTATQYLNFWKNGIKNAKTIEELASADVYLKFTVYKWKTYKFSIDIPEEKLIKTTSDFLEELKKWNEFKNSCIITEENKTFSPSIYLSFSGYHGYVTTKIMQLRKKETPKKEKVVIEQDHFFILENNNGYLVKYTRNGYKYSSYSTALRNKTFRTEKEANKYLISLINKRKHQADTWKVKKVEKQTKFLVAA